MNELLEKIKKLILDNGMIGLSIRLIYKLEYHLMINLQQEPDSSEWTVRQFDLYKHLTGRPESERVVFSDDSEIDEEVIQGFLKQLEEFISPVGATKIESIDECITQDTHKDPKPYYIAEGYMLAEDEGDLHIFFSPYKVPIGLSPSQVQTCIVLNKLFETLSKTVNERQKGVSEGIEAIACYGQNFPKELIVNSEGTIDHDKFFLGIQKLLMWIAAVRSPVRDDELITELKKLSS